MLQVQEPSKNLDSWEKEVNWKRKKRKAKTLGMKVTAQWNSALILQISRFYRFPAGDFWEAATPPMKQCRYRWGKQVGIQVDRPRSLRG